jgi:TonB family protein
MAQETRPVLRASAPEYPDLMYSSREQGKCVVAISVLPSGEVDHTHVQESPAGFIEHVLRRHAKQWRFAPAEHTTLHRVEFVFKLLPQDTPPEELGFVFVAPMTVEVRRVEPPVYTTHGPR